MNNSNELVYVFGAILLFALIALLIWYFTSGTNTCNAIIPCPPGQTCMNGVCVTQIPPPDQVLIVNRNVNQPLKNAIGGSNQSLYKVGNLNSVAVVKQPKISSDAFVTEYGIPEY